METNATSHEEALLPDRQGAWGTVLGAIGEGLLTLGLLLGLFVVWEVWWTDVTGSRHQRDIVEALDWENPVIPILHPDGGLPPGDVNDGQAYPVIPEERREREAVPPEEEAPGAAETFATLYVPRWGTDYIRPISEGVVRRSVLDKLGIGHYPSTALPGGWGNFAVAGHRTTFGKPFERIEELEEGDVIVVRTESAWYVYRVTETHIVHPSFDAAIASV
ncbi:MAG: class E sortase, partial [Demequinaceae bacterium]|nr:class E sortase [Demequinaceae bacterium]